MFPQKNRLSKKADVSITTARGRTFFSQSFLIKFLPKIGGQARFTVIVSTKTSKSAVIRNRLKRLVRHSVYELLTTIKPGDYVIILKRGSVLVEPINLKQEVKQAFLKSKLLFDEKNNH